VAIRTEWRFGRKSPACGACAKPFPHEAPFHSAIWLDAGGFRRSDLCDACFAAVPEPPYSHWRTAIPKPAAKARAFDLGLAAEFLRRLAGEGDASKAPLAYLLALLLVRKRAVRILDLQQDARGPRVRVEFHDGHPPLEIPAPPLRDDAAPALREELDRLVELGETAP